MQTHRTSPCIPMLGPELRRKGPNGCRRVFACSTRQPVGPYLVAWLQLVSTAKRTLQVGVIGSAAAATCHVGCTSPRNAEHVTWDVVDVRPPGLDISVHDLSWMCSPTLEAYAVECAVPHLATAKPEQLMPSETHAIVCSKAPAPTLDPYRRGEPYPKGTAGWPHTSPDRLVTDHESVTPP